MNFTARLHAGQEVGDDELDLLYPEEARAHSRVHWTPVDIALRAVQWLAPRPGARVLDVGSGVGKFCLVGALSSEGEFTGVELRRPLAEIARGVCRRNGVTRARFVCADATRMDWDDFEAIYFYNPFCENLNRPKRIDDELPLGRARYREYVRGCEERLAGMSRGTRVVLFHGFGGKMPASYCLKRAEWRRAGRLELWVKR